MNWTLSIENRPYVTKSREYATLTGTVKLRLTDRVTIDTPRDLDRVTPLVS